MFRFLFLGNLMEEKGILVLLDACSELKQRGKHFMCTFVGAAKDVALHEMKEHVKQRRLEDCVMIYGPAYGEEKAKILEEVDALVFPTFYHNECFPFVILEAMQQALPVISTSEGAIPDMVIHEQTGILVERRNVSALSSAMLWLIDNPHLAKEMGKAGKDLYNQSFTEERFIDTVYHILENA